ncbi:hypothetical protein ACLOJK_032544 [Asimina triloba]
MLPSTSDTISSLKSLHFILCEQETMNKMLFLIINGVVGANTSPTTTSFGTIFALRDPLMATPNPSSKVMAGKVTLSLKKHTGTISLIDFDFWNDVTDGLLGRKKTPERGIFGANGGHSYTLVRKQWNRNRDIIVGLLVGSDSPIDRRRRMSFVTPSMHHNKPVMAVTSQLLTGDCPTEDLPPATQTAMPF